MATLNQLTIQEAALGLRQKKFSSTELVADCLTAIKSKDKELHAYLEVFGDALDEAKKADEMLQNHHALPPLLGIPIAVKDNILVEGEICTAGSKILENYVASYDATVIKKLKAQGAIIIGKTNLDEFAMGSSTENSAFGPTKNPHDTRRVPGGSSGGSAAAVAADMCIAALGSDTGGSIRQPASFCGIVGLKPTYGRVSRHGLMAMASSLDQIGPLTKTVEDAKTLFEAICGSDDFDATSFKNPPENKPVNTELKNLRVGVPKEYFSRGLDRGVEEVVRQALKRVEGAGAHIEELSLQHSEYALATYYIIVPSEVSANLARYDGIRYGHQNTKADSLFGVYAQTRAEGLGHEVKRRIMLGTHALSAGYYDAYYLKAQKVRGLIRQDFENALKKVDVIIGPTTPTTAFKFDEKTSDPLQMYLADIYTVAVNLSGLPALSMPAGKSNNLPVGLQLIGQWFDETNILSIASEIEKKIHA
ncbi:MAG: Asp-tRNA(Asn)/Glu-tRNA(Gln) amidotransferase subunit GatA [Candidatus Sungiibacteriota bacterium]|uniref:Glutamyl-tRNA(Gln) amidotransferase subunit A n=1 Tax=Candidatus Sungiibacteriota bacterium TaxID=2750080 RepID=A0A7T5RL39_9BACT|nr:MAG: Asp-tRNA(Asn)/Glu-tRNA(Gln) amidotransferase subunit GatA [Candidatus Sungbacteria bacterium]